LENTKSRREAASKRLRNDLSAKTAMGERRIYISLPKAEEHQNHPTGKVICPYFKIIIIMMMMMMMMIDD